MQDDYSYFNRWFTYNALGLIPGPMENDKDYYARVEFCLSLRDNWMQLKKNHPLPFDIKDELYMNAYSNSLDASQDFYGIRPTWVPIFCSDDTLSFWQGGSTWIFQIDQMTPPGAVVQLRYHFKSSSSYLFIYSREEIITHELAHIGRMAFEESRFEEIHAYQTSESKIRRFLGAIIQKPYESIIFLILLLLIIFIDTLFLFTENFTFYTLAFILKITCAGSVFFAFLRLLYTSYLYQKCLKKLAHLYTLPVATHLIYRLTDEEIIYFGKNSIHKIKTFIRDVCPENFRWTFIKHIYPLN